MDALVVAGPVARPVAGPVCRQRSASEMVKAIFATRTGIWYDPQDLTTMYQDAQGTLPVYRPGTGLVDPPVGLMLDKSGGEHHASQNTTLARPTLSGRYNLLTGTETLSTQSVTTVATDYTLRFEGTGSITLSGAATGTYTAGTYTITCTAGTLTCTVSGTVTRADLRKGLQQTPPSYVEVIPEPTHFVSKTGSDLNDGLTEETAWLTLSHAVSAMPTGSVLQIGTGVYTENYPEGYGVLISNKSLSFVGSGDVTIKSSALNIITSQGLYNYLRLYNLTIHAEGATQRPVYSIVGLDCLLYKCTLISSSSIVLYRGTSTVSRIIDCDIFISNLTTGFSFAVADLTVPLEIVGCNISINNVAAGGTLVRNGTISSFSSIVFNDNVVSVQSGGSSASAIVMSENSDNISVQRNQFSSEATGSMTFVYVKNGARHCNLVVKNNTVYSKTTQGAYILCSGDDSEPVYKNTISTEITDNRLYGSMYYDQEATNPVHAIMCGYVSDAIVQRNTAIGFGYGVVIKGDGTSDHSGGQVFGNLFVNNTVGIYNKGPNGTKIYNNTLVNNRIYVYTNDGANNPTGLEIINNAYLMEIDTPFIEYSAPIADLVSDYNFGSSLRFSAGTLGNKTLAQWQADILLDANSIVTTPLFDNEYRIAYPSDLWASGTPITLSEPASVDMFGYLVDPSSPNIGCLVGQEELLTSTLPVYQGVVDANTYDTAGFPLHLKRDLVDDKHTLVTPTGGITGTRLQTTIGTVTTTSETLAEGVVDLFANPADGPQEITQWVQFGWVLSAYELAITKRFSKSKARLV